MTLAVGFTAGILLSAFILWGMVFLINSCSRVLNIGIAANDVIHKTFAQNRNHLYVQLRGRARSLRATAFVALVFIAVVITVGIVLFFGGTDLLKLLPTTEVKIRKQIKDLEKQIEDRQVSDAAVRAKAENMASVLGAADMVYEAMQRVIQLSRTGDRDQHNLILSQLEETERLLKAVRDKAANFEPNYLLFPSANGPTLLDQQQLSLLLKTLEREALKLDSVLTRFDELEDEATKAMASTSDDPKARQGYFKSDSVSLARRLTEWASKYRSAVHEAKDDVSRVDRELENATKANARDQRKLDALRESLKEITDQRDRIRFLAWIPDVIVRAGCVVLLLFLTGILAGTYRYIMSMAAHYDTLADTLRLVTTYDSNRQLDDDRFQKVVDIMSAKAVIEKNEIPYDFFNRVWNVKPPKQQ